MNQQAVIVDAIRSPLGRGKAGGSLSGLHPVELLAQTFAHLMERTRVDPHTIDDVIVGCVSQVGEQAGNVGRMAWLSAGLPVHVPSTTVERKCGSSQQAVHFAAQGIMAGAYDIVVVGGVESMSRIPMGVSAIGQDPYGPGVTRRFAPGLVPQGVAAELVAQRWRISRSELDEYSERSHRLAVAHGEAGGFTDEIVPIVVPGDGGEPNVVLADETPRPGTTAARLAELQPVFQSESSSARFPEIEWSVTAGNSSQITDGASAMLLMSEEKAKSLGLRARARTHSFAVAADDPILMLTGPIPATRKVMERSGLRLDDIDHFEVNEAFASVPLAWQKELGVDPAKVNPVGGAIALGHPLGASGARLMVTMLNALEASGGRYGLQTMCEAGGMANATIIERLG